MSEIKDTDIKIGNRIKAKWYDAISKIVSIKNNINRKQQNFYSELKALLLKYKAQLDLKISRKLYCEEYRIVVDFDFDEYGTGFVPQLNLGTYEDGKTNEQ